MIAFTVTEAKIEIIGVYYGGRDVDAILKTDNA